MFRKLAVASALLVFMSPAVLALGLGTIEMKSALNQPMDAVIDLTSSAGTDPDTIKVSLASVEAHSRAGLNKSAILASFRFRAVKDSRGNIVIQVTSSEAVREPYLEFLLELEWPKGHLLRQYTVLVDPPVTMQAAARPAPVSPKSTASRPATPALPAVEPVVNAPSATAPVATGVAGDYLPVRRNDTLWSIAEQLRPDAGVSVHQVMQALLRTNPQAFLDNNINRMEAGATLKIPTREEMVAMSNREAIAESRRQYADWQQETARPDTTPAEVAADKVATPETTVSEKPAAEELPAQASETSAEPRLKLVAPDEDTVSGDALPGDSTSKQDAASLDELKQQLALASEDAIAGRAQSGELQSRVAELEQQVETMTRLLQLKDHALSQLQNKASLDEAQAKAESAASEKDAGNADQESGAATDPARNLVDRLLANPILSGALALAVILLGGFLWAVSRQRRHPWEDDEPESPAVRRDVTVPPVISEPEIYRSAEPASRPAASGPANPLVEADVYLAYGRTSQAEELIRAALDAEPDNDQLQFKLLEVLHASGNVAAFEQAASDYRDGVTEDDDRWQRVAEMGRSLAPENTLFQAATGTREYLDNPDELEDFSQLDLESDEDMDGILDAEDEITTKLDLARAYIDMDDRDSARSILDEVMEEGNHDQKQEAERIIAQIA